MKRAKNKSENPEQKSIIGILNDKQNELQICRHKNALFAVETNNQIYYSPNWKKKTIDIVIKKAYLPSEYYRTTVKTVDMDTAMEKALITNVLKQRQWKYSKSSSIIRFHPFYTHPKVCYKWGENDSTHA